MRLKKLKTSFLGGNAVCFENLKTDFLARSAFYFEIIDSTQSEIFRRIADGNIDNGTLVYADFQTNGLGTHGRKWVTDEENNVAFSFYFKVGSEVRKTFWLD